MKGKYPSTMREAELGAYPQVDFLVRHGREVARKQWLLIIIVGFVFATLAGLGAAAADPRVTALAAQAFPGSYELSFLTNTGEPVSSLPVGEELVLKAHVEDSSGNPAQRGDVIFQDCLMKGVPAPSAACDSGTGSWSHITSMSVDASGNAYVDYGFVSTPRTIGFRFRYIGQGSGIANGVSASRNFTWF